MKRRKFISYAIGGTALAYAGWRSSAGALRRFTQSGHALGTKVAITVYHKDAAIAEQAIQSAFGAIEQIERVMSLYRDDSQVSRLNQYGYLDRPDPELLHVLNTSVQLSEQTGGAFDITVQPLWQLYSSSAQEGGLPSPAAISAARAKTGWQRIEITDTTVRLLGEGTQITLNGIAQGYAADAACSALREHGIEHALIDSGEIGSYGSKSGERDWTIGIRHPRKQGDLLGLAGFQDRCLATSGDYETSFSDDFASNHLFDPRTGQSPLKSASVSVVAGTATEADALSTAAFILGPDKGFKLIQTTTGADALFVCKSGETKTTAGFPLYSNTMT